jgi:hypothetical protein
LDFSITLTSISLGGKMKNVKKMKLFTLVLCGTLVTLCASMAYAGRDENFFRQTRKKHSDENGSEASSQKRPLDHGPHAVVTPWMNEQSKLRDEEQKKAAQAGTQNGNSRNDDKTSGYSQKAP